jgi:tRNA (guanine-N7-)-methyltransferase
MSFGLGHGRPLDPAPGVVAISQEELGRLPDDILTNPDAGRTDPRQWFPEPGRRFELEIGSGKGTFLVQQAELQPDTNFLGIEWAGEFCAYAADRVRRRRAADGSFMHVRLLRADATEFLRWRCPAGVCSVIHLYFSDPWPKRKHHKNRVVQHRFLLDAWRALTPGGELRIVTDHDGLWAWDEAHFAMWTTPGGLAGETPAGIPAPGPDVLRAAADLPDPPFERLAFDRPGSAREGELVGTNFERKFRAEGRSFHGAVLRRVG